MSHHRDPIVCLEIRFHILFFRMAPVSGYLKKACFVIMPCLRETRLITGKVAGKMDSTRAEHLRGISGSQSINHKCNHSSIQNFNSKSEDAASKIVFSLLDPIRDR